MKKFHTLFRGFMLALVLVSLINPSTIDLAQAAAPAVVTNVVPVPASGQVTLTWTNPASVDFTGTMVRYSTSTFPTSTSDGTLASDVAGAVSGSSSVTVTGLSNGTTYYFSLFSHNAVPEYSAAVNARQLVMGSVFSDDFQSLTAGNVSGQNGWNIVAGTWNVLDTSGEKTLKTGTENLNFDQYRALNGGNVKTYANQMVRADWRGTTINSPGQLFLRAQSSTADAGGYTLTQSGGLLRISYKSSTGSSFTSMATGAFTPVANTWYTYEFSVMNNASGLPVLNAYVWTRGSAKPSTPTVTATDTFNRFNQGFFSVGKSGLTAAEYDNVTFFGMMSNTASKIFPSDSANTLTWTNSASASYTGSMVRVSTSAYPTSPTDGTLVSSVSGSASASSSVTHSGLTNGTQYFYAVFPYDGSGNYGTPLLLSQTPYAESVSDDFNASSLGTVVAQNGWGKEAGTWEVSDVSGERVLSAPSANSYLTNMAVNGSSSSINQILSYRYKTDTTSNTVGYCWLRRQANNDGYLIWHNANVWTISYQSGATFASLATGTATTVNAQEANVWFNVEASVINNGSNQPVITVYVWKEGNEKPVTPTVTFTDSNRFTNGTFALSRNTGAVAAYYDDVHFAASVPTTMTPATMTITSPAADVVAEPDTATLAITDEKGTFYIPYIQTSTTLNVQASMAGIPDGGGVRFVLNEGLEGEQVVNDVTAPTYTASFAGLAKDEYTLDAYEILGDGVTVSGDPDAHDYLEHIGIGDIYTVMGDSTSDGTSGTYVATPVNSWLDAAPGSLSADHRNFPQSDPSDSYYKESFLSDLNDKISAYSGYPVFFMNEAYIGLGTFQYENQAMRSGWTTRQLALDANKWLVSLGNGDSQQPHDAATFQADMEGLLARLVASYGASYENIYIPYSFYDSTDPAKDTLLSYHPVIDSMLSSLGLAGGPNLYETFINHKPAEYEGIHPNAAGYERIARLWAIAIMQPRVTPVVSGHQITLNWDDLSNYESTISGYKVSYGTAADDLDQTVTLGDVTTTTLTGLSWGTTYYYSVVGFDNDAYSVSYTDSSPVASVSIPAGASAANVSAITGNTTELGGTATFTVVLNSRPDADVSMPISSSDTTEGTVAPSSLTFTSSNWSTPQTVTVTGVDDDFADGNGTYSIVIGAMSSTDLTYDAVNPSDVSVTNTDNETAGFTSTAISGNTTEVGGMATFTVVLNSEPTADVTIAVSSSDTTEGTVAPSSLTFTALNWDTPQTVTVTGVNDAEDDGDVSYNIVFGVAVSVDDSYDGLDLANVSVSTVDDDAPAPTETGGSTIPHIVAPVTPPVVVPETPSNLPELTTEQQQVVETNMQTLDVTLPQDWSADYLQNLVQENAVMEAALQESSFHTVLVNMFEQPHFGIERAEAVEFLLVVSGVDITDLNVDSQSSYSDVTPDYLRAIYVEYATEHNLVGGYSDGRFDPERVMNRAEALKMVANFFEIEVDTSLRGEMLLKAYELSENPFTDADLEAWYAPYLITLYSKGVVQGYADGRFGADESISNSELLKMATVVQGL